MKKSIKSILFGLVVICGIAFCALSCSKQKVTCTCYEYWDHFGSGPWTLSNTFTVNPEDEGFNTCQQFETYMIAQNENEGFNYDCQTN